MPDHHATTIATDLLYREGALLDNRDWDRWLDLYARNAVYWVPAWRDECEQTADPDTEISQIYHDARRGLEERVMRVRSGKSVIALPLPRTTHFVTNIDATMREPGVVSARANWMVQVYEPRSGKQYANFGHYELRLAEHDAAWRIAWKKIQLKNDLIPALIEFYTL